MYDIFDVKDVELSKKIQNLEKRKIYDVLVMNNNKWFIVVENSSVLDLAFRFNNEKFLYLKSVFREGIPVPLSYNPIKDDTITFEYSTTITATEQWFNYLTIEDAKDTLKSFLSKSENVKSNETNLREYLGDLIESDKEIKKRLKFLNFDTIENYLNFYLKDNLISEDTVFNFLSKKKN